jgi:hypothetical protein
MTQIDSKEQKLSTPEIIARVATQAHTEEMPAQTILVAFVQEASMPNTTVDTYGNTVFITHYDETKTKAVGRALNMDVARNFIDNGAEYFRDLHRRGVRRFSTWFAEPSFAMAFAAFRRKPVTSEMDMQIVPTTDGQTAVFIKLDGDLI